MIVAATRRRRSSDDLHLALVASLGGDAAVIGFYNTTGSDGTAHASVVRSGGLVDEWRDYRGATGYGPALTALSTKRPAFDEGAATITTDGVDDVLSTVASPLFDLSTAKGLIAISSNAKGATGFYTAAIVNAAVSRWFGLYVDLNGTIQHGGTAYDGLVQNVVLSGVNTGVERRILIAGWSGTIASIEIPDRAKVNAPANVAIGSSNMILSFGGFNNTGGYSPCVGRALIVMNRVPTVSDVAVVRTWALANHAPVLA